MEKEIENRKEKKAHIICRSNTLWENYVPIVERTLKSKGYKIEKKVFPQGTSEEKIKEYFIKNKDRFDEKSIKYMDHTCWGCFDMPGFVEGLDAIAHNAAMEAILGKELLRENRDAGREKGMDDFQNREDFTEYNKILYGNLIKNVPNRPSKIGIVAKYMTHHEPFESFFGRGSSEDDLNATKMLKDWFRGAGIKEVRTYTDLEDISDEGMGKNDWMVIDGHVSGRDEYSKKEYKLVEPGIAGLIYDLRENLVFENERNSFESALEEIILEGGE